MFVFGSQYLRGESPRQEDWDMDMANMKKLGFNTIRAWLVWSTVEPREGQIKIEKESKDPGGKWIPQNGVSC